MLLMTGVLLARASALVYPVADGGDGLQMAVHVGAYPGASQVARIDLHARTSAVAPCPPYYTATEFNGTDVLYVAGSVQRVPAAAASTVLAWDTLVPAGGVFGVCNNQLYLSELPRRCRVGRSGVRHCRRHHCNVSFAESHRGTCIDGSARLALGTYEMTVACAVTTAFGRRSPAVTPGPPVLSVMRAALNVEYDDNSNTLRVWEQPTAVDTAVEYVMILFLTLALAAWLGWSASLNATQRHNDMEAAAVLWERIADVGLFVADAVWLAASAKVYHVVTESAAIMPEAVDQLLGADTAAAYTVWYVGVVCTAAAAVVYVVTVAMASTGRSLPKFVCAWVAPHVAVCRAGPSRLAALVTLRWLYEAVLLTAVHLCTPGGLGESFVEVVGAGVGLSLAAVTGRDATCLMGLCRANATRVAVFVSAAVVMFHVALFMVYPCVASQYEGDSTTVLLSAAVTAQVSAVSALYHRPPRAPPHAFGHPVAASGAVRPGRF